MVEIADVLDALDLAIARSEGVLPPETSDRMAAAARRARTRTGFVGEALVVALAGGTGSGKSSLLNALLGADIVATGVTRPTTQLATAVHAPRPFADLGPLLEELDVDTIEIVPTAGDVVYVDLPDFDSTERAHRHVVERVLPRVDAVVWVLDPEKYADPVLHRGFLGRLADHESQFVFALNQADRIPGDVTTVVESLAAHLVADGFRSPDIVATVGVAIGGRPPNVTALEGVVERRLDRKSTALSKLALDMRSLASEGWLACRAVDLRNLGEQSRDTVALAAATFVWLGVTAYELYGRIAGHREG
jgi:GTP-binding protein EngB required for normal cell division